MSDELTSMRAAMDQLAKLREDEAAEVAGYWRGLRRAGVPRLLAAKLTVDWHAAACWRGYDDDGED